MKDTTARHGYAHAMAAYTMWGLLPAYWKMLAELPSLEVIAHRVIWSPLFLLSICAANRTPPHIVTRGTFARDYLFTPIAVTYLYAIMTRGSSHF